MGRDSTDIEAVVSLLFSHAVDINLRTLREGDTPLHIAVSRFDGGEAMTLALKLLSLGADPDYRNDVWRVLVFVVLVFEIVEWLNLYVHVCMY